MGLHSSGEVLGGSEDREDSGAGAFHTRSQAESEASPAAPHQSLPRSLDPRTATEKPESLCVLRKGLGL